MTNELIRTAWERATALLVQRAMKGHADLSEEAKKAFVHAAASLAEAETDGGVCIELIADVTPEQMHEWHQAGLVVWENEAGTAPWLVDRRTEPPHLYNEGRFAEEGELAERLATATAVRPTCHPLSEERKAAFYQADRFFGEKLTGQAREEWLAGLQHQYEAVEKALNRRFSIITGGPGTGKTSVVTRILSELLRAASKPLHIVLTAPTGKAASRLKESIDAECARSPELYAPVYQAVNEGRIRAMTVHRLLSTYDDQGRRPSEVHPIDADVLVTDEASMLEETLALKLLRVTALEKTRVIFLGDRFQLSAVGPGSVFADMTEGALQEAVTELSYSFRFSRCSPLGQLADAVKRGDADAMFQWLYQESETGGALRLISDAAETTNMDTWLKGASVAYRKAVKARLQLDWNAGEAGRTADEAMWAALAKFRVLTAQRSGANGADVVNALMAYELRDLTKAAKDEPFYLGRVVIVRKNDRQTGLYNGDVGIVTYSEGPTTENGLWRVYFGEGRYCPAALLPPHDTGFALTIHQSQGSQFDTVAVVPAPNPASPLNTRELLYTGITRAKRSVTVFGSAQTVWDAVKRREERKGQLSRRLREEKAALRSTVIFYVHGFMSGVHTKTGCDLQSLFPENDVKILGYESAQPYPVVMEGLLKQIDGQSQGRPFVLVGSSLGGFYAERLSEALKVPCLLINPVTNPRRQLRQYLGLQTSYEDGRQYELTEDWLLSYPESVTRTGRVPTVTYVSRQDVVLPDGLADVYARRRSTDQIVLMDEGHRPKDVKALPGVEEKMLTLLAWRQNKVWRQRG